AEALSNLASGLPDSSLFDKWFGGDQTLASFGGDISKFGAAMKDYYGQISGIDTGQMADVVAQVWSLLELAEGAAGVNTSGLTGFADSMRKMGDADISGFTSAFSTAATRSAKPCPVCCPPSAAPSSPTSP
ncbi:MAG: hypothetical protein ACLRIS_15975, partial [Flavonifractor plautii]